MIPPRHAPTAVALAAAAVLLSGCGAHAQRAAAFTPGGDTSCMHHQPHPPTAADSAPTTNLAARLAVLRYYTAHGQQAYCDGAAATATDLAWMRLFVADGASPTLVSRWVHP